MKKVLYLLIAALFVACSKEDDLTPTGLVKDWFAIQPGEGAWNEMAYEIYRDYGCSVFKNDTLGREFRGLDANGDSIIYYETLKIGYSIERYSEVDFALCYDEERLVEALRMVKDLVMPAMREIGSVPLCYLLVDTVKSDSVTAAYGLQDFEATLIGMTVTMPDSTMKRITDFDTEERDTWVTEIKLLGIMSKLTTTYSHLVDEFYDYQQDLVDGAGTSRNLFSYGYDNVDIFYREPVLDDVLKYGFLNWASIRENPRSSEWFLWWNITNPSKEQDMKAYVVATLEMTEEEFEKEYAAYPYVLQKFAIMQNIMRQAGFVK